MGGRTLRILEADVLHDGGGLFRRRQGADPPAVHLAPQHDVVAMMIAVQLPLRGGHGILQRHACAHAR